VAVDVVEADPRRPRRQARARYAVTAPRPAQPRRPAGDGPGSASRKRLGSLTHAQLLDDRPRAARARRTAAAVLELDPGAAPSRRGKGRAREPSAEQARQSRERASTLARNARGPRHRLRASRDRAGPRYASLLSVKGRIHRKSRATARAGRPANRLHRWLLGRRPGGRPSSPHQTPGQARPRWDEWARCSASTTVNISSMQGRVVSIPEARPLMILTLDDAVAGRGSAPRIGAFEDINAGAHGRGLGGLVPSPTCGILTLRAHRPHPNRGEIFAIYGGARRVGRIDLHYGRFEVHGHAPPRGRSHGTTSCSR